jgi:hypothetical protein
LIDVGEDIGFSDFCSAIKDFGYKKSRALGSVHYYT